MKHFESNSINVVFFLTESQLGITKGSQQKHESEDEINAEDDDPEGLLKISKRTYQMRFLNDAVLITPFYTKKSPPKASKA